MKRFAELILIIGAPLAVVIAAFAPPF